MEIKCKFCSNYFFKNRIDKIYCSKICLDKHRKEKAIKPYIVKRCVVCSNEFNTKFQRSLYCSVNCKNKVSYDRRRDKILLQKKEYHSRSEVKVKRNYYEKNLRPNKEQRNKQKNLWQKEQYYINPLFKLKFIMRRRINIFLKSKNFNKNNNTTFEIIGCTPEELRDYLEKQFKEGMNWKNYGLWHVDHIVPLASCSTQEEALKLCHYTNLQPLWAFDNLSKGSKIIRNVSL